MAKQPDQDADLGAAGNTSELDEYGVFVKSGPREVDAPSADDVSLSDLDAAEDALEADSSTGGLPDLDDLSFTDDLGIDDVSLELPPGAAPSGETDFDLGDAEDLDLDLNTEEFDLGDSDSGGDEVGLDQLPMDELDLEDELADAGDAGFVADVTPKAMDNDLPDTEGDIGFAGAQGSSAADAEPDLDEISLDELNSSVAPAGAAIDSDDELGFDDVAAVTDDFSADSAGFDSDEGIGTAGDDPFAGDSDFGGVKESGAGADDSQIRAQLEDELRSIHQELAALRRELAELRSGGISVAGSPGGASSAAAAEPSPSEPGPGFFEQEDSEEDEAIALTAGELDNILNNAEFTETAGEGEEMDADILEASGMATDVPDDVFSGAFDSGADDDSLTFADSDDSEFAVSDIDLEPMDDMGTDVSSPAGTASEDAILDDEDSLDFSDDDFQLPDGSPDSVTEMANLDIDSELEDIGELADEPGLSSTLDIPPTPDVDFDDEEIARVAREDLVAISGEGPGGASAVADVDAEVAELDELEDDFSGSEDDVQELTGTQTPADSDLDEAELKDVLKIMDQLLADLPEDKVREFSYSEHYEVYKKLFDQLGI